MEKISIHPGKPAQGKGTDSSRIRISSACCVHAESVVDAQHGL